MKLKPHKFSLEPNFTEIDQVEEVIRRQGYAYIAPGDLFGLVNTTTKELQALTDSWHHLTLDEYLKDGGKYRKRRHASLKLHQSEVDVVPQRAHWQPTTYNALHGGMHRWFDPITADVLSSKFFKELLTWLAKVAEHIDGTKFWYGEAHQFRIDTTDGIGRPTPEGAHRDGVDWVALCLIERHNVTGGETHIFEVDTMNGQRFTMSQPWSLLILNDRRVIHETTPIQPNGTDGWRDTLVITLRAEGFLDDTPENQKLQSKTIS
ncbi:MAG: 2OG-Fe dioxygenase family protein [Proteobacteria bacterium]|nr:2OG-Fe dioxygenase family protein [Pseudomonadota bacterium]MDA1332480.1 2OG-Fe dioxygenase family protein [Pseudomonadota bacterium]